MKKFLKTFLTMCHICYGLGTKETGDDTVSCPGCKGKGYK